MCQMAAYLGTPELVLLNERNQGRNACIVISSRHEAQHDSQGFCLARVTLRLAVQRSETLQQGLDDGSCIDLLKHTCCHASAHGTNVTQLNSHCRFTIVTDGPHADGLLECCNACQTWKTYKD